MSEGISRRRLLESGAAAIGASVLARGAEGKRRMYVGSYSSPQGPEGSKGRGSGIYQFEMDGASGDLRQVAMFEDAMNPSWLALHPTGRFLYAANEVSNFEGNSGAVTAYGVESATGQLTRLNTVSSEGAGPAHLSVHPSGRFVFVANYHGGSFAVLPVGSDGRLSQASDVKRDTGKLGGLHAKSAPEGSYAISGHDRTHGHMIEADPKGQFVVGADLGMDRILVWRFDAAGGKLEQRQEVTVPDGDGPRHFVFHPNGRWMYSLQEEGSTLALFDYETASGRLTMREQVSTLPKGFCGTNFTSEVRISKDGRFVYAANRLHDSIAWFRVAGDGRVTLEGEVWTRGDYPRSFTIDPSGRWLYCCNQRADAVTCFEVDRQGGGVRFTGKYLAVGTPSVVVFG